MDASAAGAIDVFWIVGGNFLETLAGASRNRAALARPGLRIHQDIVVNRAMLVEPSDTVLLLPATTRYEIPGGVTETSTERRIIFSPEIPGRRIGSARPEWEVFGDVCARVRPEDAEKIRFQSTAAIRAEIARAIPLYAGIETLAKAATPCSGAAQPSSRTDASIPRTAGRGSRRWGCRCSAPVKDSFPSRRAGESSSTPWSSAASTL